MYATWILFEKFHWQVLLKYTNNTEAISDWRLNCGKYVMNGTDWQLVCYSTFCSQYIASVYYPYKNISSVFRCSIFYINILLLLLVFNETYCQRFSDTGITVTSKRNQDVTKEAAVTVVFGHDFRQWLIWNSFMGDFLLIHIWICINSICFEASWWNRNWYLDFGHCGVTNDMGSSPQPSSFALGQWWASQAVGNTTMTSILVSIPIFNTMMSQISVMQHCSLVQKCLEISSTNWCQSSETNTSLPLLDICYYI